MVKPALAAGRAARVLDFLSDHAGQAHTLTEIARALRVNAPSTLAVLTALTELGYVVRHPTHKTYVLGPALVAVGYAALAQHPALDLARTELGLLADEIEGGCSASVLVGDEIVSVVTAGRARSLVSVSRVGARAPYRTPFGAPFAAWGRPEDAVRWIASGSLGDPVRAQRLAHALAVVREQGVAVGGTSEASDRMSRLLWGTIDDRHDLGRLREIDALASELTDTFLDDIADSTDLAATTLTVPVFGAKREVAMIITAFGFHSPLGPDEVRRIGARLRASAHLITDRTFGASAGHP